MKFTVKLEVADADLERLTTAAGVLPAELQTILPGHARSSFAEYVEHYLGRRALSRGTDILEHRLHLLIRHAYANRVPGEAEVSGLFQTTPSQSRTLVRNALSQYRFDLVGALNATVKATLEAARYREGDFQLDVQSSQILDVMRRKLEQLHSAETPIARTLKASTWTLKRASYRALCTDSGVTPVAER